MQFIKRSQAGIWALMDQFLFSGSSFIINILLARWLIQYDYGYFAFVFSFYVIAGLYHNAFIIEPSLVFGPSEYRTKLKSYFSVLGKIHHVLMGILLLGAVTAYVFFSLPLLWTTALIATPVMLWNICLRRLCYIDRNKVKVAALLGVLRCIIAFITFFYLKNNVGLNAESYFICFIPADLISGILLFHYLKNTAPDHEELKDRPVIIKHLHYGKWTAGTATATILHAPIYIPLLTYTHGFEEVAHFKSIENLFLPIAQILTALSSLALSNLAEKKQKLTTLLFSQAAVKTGLFFTFIASGYLLFLLLSSEALMDLFYDGKYKTSYGVILLLGWVFIARGFRDGGIANALRATHNNKYIFKAAIGTGLLSAAASFPLVSALGMLGLACTRGLGATVQTLMLLFDFSRLKKKDFKRGK